MDDFSNEWLTGPGLTPRQSAITIPLHSYYSDNFRGKNSTFQGYLNILCFFRSKVNNYLSNYDYDKVAIINDNTTLK